MKAVFILTLCTCPLALAQDAPPPPQFHVQVAGPGVAVAGGDVGFVTAGAFGKAFGAPVQGAPYSATMTNESVQTLADGNRIVQTSTGTMARDSLGRTRQDAPLPTIGNISPAKAPHLVFIQDPVAQTSYVLNLTEKTAMKGPGMPPPPPGAAGAETKMVMRGGVAATAAIAPRGLAIQIADNLKEQGEVTSEDLGSQTMEGVLVTGTRTTRTIPAGQIGNDKPISIVTEVWTSPELKTVVYSKRTDPRMGEQTFKLTNIVRAEPDPTLFSVPSGFEVIDGAEPIVYHANQ
ncbi:MAG TPA: hypothetical protein VMH80_11575 [Bryobacteraceae bacterium]|nr:hypothetical protein [Bryobacteraceae bacterium]